jgi:hypothetical protein
VRERTAFVFFRLQRSDQELGLSALVRGQVEVEVPRLVFGSSGDALVVALQQRADALAGAGLPQVHRAVVRP